MKGNMTENLNNLGLSVIIENPIASLFIIFLWIIIGEMVFGNVFGNSNKSVMFTVVGVMTTMYLFSAF